MTPEDFQNAEVNRFKRFVEGLHQVRDQHRRWQLIQFGVQLLLAVALIAMLVSNVVRVVQCGAGR